MGPILGRELLRISLVHAVALAIWYLQTHTHTLADNFPFFLTFFRALFLKESPFFPVGKLSPDPSPNPVTVGSLFSTEKSSSVYPERGELKLTRAGWGGQGEQRKKGCANKGGLPTGCRLE